MERTLIEQYEARIHEILAEVLPDMQPAQLDSLHQLLGLPLSMRGFGHVKLRNIESARQREAWLLHRLLPARYAKPEGTQAAGALRGIAVVSVR